MTKRGRNRMSRRHVYTRKAKRVYHRAKGFLGKFGGGDLSIKSLAFGTAGLIVADRYQPFGGAYRGPINKIAIGVVGPMVGMDNKDMLTVGVKEALAITVNSLLGGGSVSGGGSTL